MSVYHSKDYIYAVLEEDAYASGKGSTLHDQTALEAGDVAELVTMPLPSDGPNIPLLEYEWEKLKAPSLGADTVVQAIKGIKYNDFVIPQYVQVLADGTYWIDKAFEAITGGIVQTSYTFHFESGENQSDIFGAVIKEYSLTIEDGFLTESITFLYYSIKDTAGGATTVTNLRTSKPFITTAPSIMKDFHLTLDGDDVSEYIVSGSVKITFDLDDRQPAGRYYRFDPVVSARDVLITCKLRGIDPSAQIRIPSSTAANLISIILSVNGNSNYWTLTNFRCSKSNANDMPKEGIKEYDLEFENRGACTYTKT
jgi:hypothetical protein